MPKADQGLPWMALHKQLLSRMNDMVGTIQAGAKSHFVIPRSDAVTTIVPAGRLASQIARSQGRGEIMPFRGISSFSCQLQRMCNLLNHGKLAHRCHTWGIDRI